MIALNRLFYISVLTKPACAQQCVSDNQTTPYGVIDFSKGEPERCRWRYVTENIQPKVVLFLQQMDATSSSSKIHLPNTTGKKWCKLTTCNLVWRNRRVLSRVMPLLRIPLIHNAFQKELQMSRILHAWQTFHCGFANLCYWLRSYCNCCREQTNN